MNGLEKRLQKLEGSLGEVWEPPVIVRWMVNPQDPNAWAVALVRDGNGMKKLKRRSGETIERFEMRVERIAEHCATGAS